MRKTLSRMDSLQRRLGSQEQMKVTVESLYHTHTYIHQKHITMLQKHKTRIHKVIKTKHSHTTPKKN
ncbi:unnamed protein product [Arabidopsis halleri]